PPRGSVDGRAPNQIDREPLYPMPRKGADAANPHDAVLQIICSRRTNRVGRNPFPRRLDWSSITLNHYSGFRSFRITRRAVVAGLVPATPGTRAKSKQNRGGGDKPATTR